jgi:hypothetical protein
MLKRFNDKIEECPGGTDTPRQKTNTAMKGQK